MKCCFIGHKDATSEIFPALLNEVTELIDNKGVDTFYVGNNGAFDRMSYNIIKTLKDDLNTDIDINVVLAYMPKEGELSEYENTIYPEGLETVPKRFAISKRNEWMIDNSDIVVCYVRNTFTNAHKFREYAKSKNKIIIDV